MKGFIRLLLAVAAGLLLTATAFAQNTLRGKVTDAAGAPLPGVTVMVKGTVPSSNPLT